MDTIAVPVETNSDIDLEAAVSEAIRGLDILRPTRAEVDIAVSRGQVTLTGIVPSVFAATEALRAVEAIPGVQGVTNHLYDDATITRQAAHALVTDARTKDIPLGYQVTCFFGHLGLIGHFSAEQQQAMTEVCQAVEGVRGIKVLGSN